ncbi:MAG: Stp1/IreP family PP2C-type Ser/Thr phosphatase [Bradymonadales bacterium]|nr:Stp1/IreP family PP2C-type Ser/Thr phosphatase [Bradymonadales bacterium]
MRIRYAGNTNVGMKRSHNEDSLYLMPSMNLYLVADGMGGHSSGEVASQMAVEAIAQFFQETSEDDEITWPFKMDKDKEYQENRLITGIKLANRRIFESAQSQPRYKGMGTTVVAVYFANGGSYVAHVGDSRVYRIRRDTITQITEDHSLLNDYIKMKELTPEEIENFPHKNVIVRALGMKETVQVDTQFEIPQNGDIYLLCSDGLSGMVDSNNLLRLVLEANQDLEMACQKVIDEANRNGGTDNITVVLGQYLDD